MDCRPSCRRTRRLINLAFRFFHPQEWPWFWYDACSRSAAAAAGWLLAAWAALLAACARLWRPLQRLQLPARLQRGGARRRPGVGQPVRG